MGIVREKVNKQIHNYVTERLGARVNKEVPLPDSFTLHELYAIGRCIADEVEGMLSDKIVKGV